MAFFYHGVLGDPAGAQVFFIAPCLVLNRLRFEEGYDDASIHVRRRLVAEACAAATALETT